MDDLAAAADDFGHLVHHRPAEIVRPGATTDLAEAISTAAARDTTLVVRGEGHSVHGQAQTTGALADLRGLSEVLDVGADRITVQAGARWSAVLAATLPLGLTPPVLTDYLELSVGGTLSAGGFGGTSHRYGPQTSTVLELEVVTGDGAVHTCAPGDPLCDAVLGGLGLCAVITRATLRLIPAHTHARRYVLGFADLPALTAAQRALVADDRFDYLEGQAQADESGRWRYLLEATAFHTPPDELGDAELLRGLDFMPGSAEVESLSYLDFVDRMAPGEAYLRSTGEWSHPHPWVNLLVPDAAVEEFVGATMDALTVAGIGASGVVLSYPVRGAGPLPRMPQGELAFLFAVLRTAPPDAPAVLDAMITANDELCRQVRAVGGSLYPVGTRDPDGLATHFGPVWPALRQAKLRHDPANVLGSSQLTHDRHPPRP